MYLWPLGSFKSASYQNDLVRKSQIRELPCLRKVYKSNKLFESKNLRICDLQELFADSPPLLFRNIYILSRRCFKLHFSGISKAYTLQVIVHKKNLLS
jgi:hypothetical protein